MYTTGRNVNQVYMDQGRLPDTAQHTLNTGGPQFALTGVKSVVWLGRCCFVNSNVCSRACTISATADVNLDRRRSRAKGFEGRNKCSLQNVPMRRTAGTKVAAADTGRPDEHRGGSEQQCQERGTLVDRLQARCLQHCSDLCTYAFCRIRPECCWIHVHMAARGPARPRYKLTKGNLQLTQPDSCASVHLTNLLIIMRQRELDS